MPAALAERSETEVFYADRMPERFEEKGASGDRISSRGLEILRILNDVFNHLPAEMCAVNTDMCSHG